MVCLLIAISIGYEKLARASIDVEPVTACVVTRETPLTPLLRERIAQCLSWADDPTLSTCRGAYTPITVTPWSDNPEAIQIKADDVSLYAQGRSQLSGHVQVQQQQRIISAETAYVYRDANTNQVTKVELLGEVRFIEPGRLMVARKATLNPQDQSGTVEDVLYRFTTNRMHATLPSWGRARLIERFANKNYELHQATYTTCLPHQESWHIEAQDIKLNPTTGDGIAKNATLKVGQVPVFYSPYLTFPFTNARKSGFLMPLAGYTNVGGFDAALPYYWNMAPNYDAVITPHLYTRRGMMMGESFRYLTTNSTGSITAQVLPKDHAFGEFLEDHRQQFPQLDDVSTNRWSVLMHDSTKLMQNLSLNVDFQQVSDDYYLQDFSTNLGILTQNQLLRQGDVTYFTDHWLMRGMLQSYQTLHPINQAPIADAYQRLPQLAATGNYYDLPMGFNTNIITQFDYFKWPNSITNVPQGPRYHLNPILSWPHLASWGYSTPSVEFVENYYDVNYGIPTMPGQTFNRTIPRYSLDNGLFFERSFYAFDTPYTQTLEPRLFFLYVPYHGQSQIPVFDSGYMIFNTDQLFRTNRFSGFDRIADANQMSYAVTTRWLSETTGLEKASLTVGQISYFDNRRVQLCYNPVGPCVDSPLTLGYLSPVASTSPIASHGAYRFNAFWSVTGDYVWDTFTQATNNGNLNLHYQSPDNQLLTLGYTYLVNGNLLPAANGRPENNALHQGTIAVAAPITDRWSTLGAFSYNISKGYSMLELIGLQYENCCWATRLMGGRTFMDLNPNNFKPQYNNNVYFQVLLKGLGSVANSNPSSVINTTFPGYRDLFG